MGATLLRHLHTERDKRRVSETLSRYRSPAVMQRVLAEPDRLKLGGKRKELTILSVSIHGFQETIERLEPEEIDELLGTLFEQLTDIVFEFQGTVNQFSGHGLRAFFGDPVPQPDHAERAVRCALEALRRGQELLTDWAGSSRPRLPLGIGVHTGYVTVGNVGSRARMEYTVLGRNVMLADELSQASGGKVLASARTVSLAGKGFAFEERGVHAGLRCFEPYRRA